nr:ABC transporter permease [Aureimonas jatrophae]
MRLALLLAFVAAVAFALMKLSPVDPIDAYLGPAIARASPEQRAQIASSWGLDQPAPVQFGRWAARILQGDLGWSTSYAAPVGAVLAERGLPSLRLTAPAWILSGAVGFAIGLLAGAFEGSWLDRTLRLGAYLTASAPSFWVAILLLSFFSVTLRWTPLCCAGPIGVEPDAVTLLQRLYHLVLPLLALSLVGIPQVALHTRAKVAEIMRSDFVLLARAQGATTGDILLRHVARNAALPAVAILFASLSEILGGAILAEAVFNYPGLGRATLEAALTGDVPLLLAITLLATLVVTIGNQAGDVLSRRLDPRTRTQRPALLGHGA